MTHTLKELSRIIMSKGKICNKLAVPLFKNMNWKLRQIVNFLYKRHIDATVILKMVQMNLFEGKTEMQR